MAWRKMDIFEIILRLRPIWYADWMWKHEEERRIKVKCKFMDWAPKWWHLMFGEEKEREIDALFVTN